MAAACLFLAGGATFSASDAQPAPGGLTGAWYPAGACGTVSYTATAHPQAVTIDGNGYLCTKGSATITGTVTVDPTGVTAIAPVVSGALENAHILKNTAGRLYSAYASSLTGGTGGNLLIFDATSAPVDGAVTPKVCVPFNSNGLASANYQGMPPGAFAVGITAVISSAYSCLTKTTGVTTAFISGIVQ